MTPEAKTNINILMNVYRKFAAGAVLALSAAFGMAAEGQEIGAAEVSQQAAPQGKVIQSRLDRLTRELQLNAEQRGQVGSILKEHRAALKQIRVDTTLTDDVKKAKRRELTTSSNSRIREVLTADQQALFDQSLNKKRRTKSSS